MSRIVEGKHGRTGIRVVGMARYGEVSLGEESGWEFGHLEGCHAGYGVSMCGAAGKSGG